MEQAERTILIVDDEEKILKVLEINLKEKYRLLLARNGDEAINCLRNAAVDLMLTDERMPGRNGMDLLSFVQQHYRHVPVIIVTAFGSVEHAVHAMKMEARCRVRQCRRRLNKHTILMIHRRGRGWSHRCGASGCWRPWVFGVKGGKYRRWPNAFFAHHGLFTMTAAHARARQSR